MSSQSTTLSRRTVAALHHELARLAGLRDEIESKMSAINYLLRGSQEEPEPAGPPLPDTPMPVRIRELLDDTHGRGTDVTEVARLLGLEGYRESTGRSLTRVVGTELHRMAKRRTGGVYRVAPGVYAISKNGDSPE